MGIVMNFLFGYLPDDVDEGDIEDFLSHFCTVDDVSFIEHGNNCVQSEYECIASLDISNRIQGVMLQQRLNNYCWKGRCIHSRMLLF